MAEETPAPVLVDQASWERARRVINDPKRVYDVVEEMERFGGSFVVALAGCWRHADPFNRGRLQNVFVEYFVKYANDVLRRSS